MHSDITFIRTMIKASKIGSAFMTFKKINKQRKTFWAMTGLLTLFWAAEVGTVCAADFQPLNFDVVFVRKKGIKEN